MDREPGRLTAFYPVSLDVAGRACLVVGGGPVAARKARSLLDCGAIVTVVAPDVCAAMAELDVTHHRAPPLRRRRSRARIRLVITATGRSRRRRRGASPMPRRPACGSTVPTTSRHCSFILPSVHRDGPVTVAVSTGRDQPGPGLVAAARGWPRRADPGWAQLAELLGQARQSLHETRAQHRDIDWAALLDGPFLELVLVASMDEAQALVEAATGNTSRTVGTRLGANSHGWATISTDPSHQKNQRCRGRRPAIVLASRRRLLAKRRLAASAHWGPAIPAADARPARARPRPRGPAPTSMTRPPMTQPSRKRVRPMAEGQQEEPEDGDAVDAPAGPVDPWAKVPLQRLGHERPHRATRRGAAWPCWRSPPG